MAIKDRYEEKRICEDIIRVLDKPHRLIDADRLKSDFVGNRYGTQAIEYVIDQQPTVDVEPVRHGHWVGKEDQRWHCSECDEIAPKGYRYNYCPDCGAKMDGERR